MNSKKITLLDAKGLVITSDDFRTNINRPESKGDYSVSHLGVTSKSFINNDFKLSVDGEFYPGEKSKIKKELDEFIKFKSVNPLYALLIGASEANLISRSVDLEEIKRRKEMIEKEVMAYKERIAISSCLLNMNENEHRKITKSNKNVNTEDYIINKKRKRL